MTRYITALLLLTASLSASAGNFIEPESGWWFNPNESGYGFDIEQQSNTLLVGIFTYDQNGNPVWYTASGDYDSVNGTFSGAVQHWSGGPCLGCSYQAPKVDSNLGDIIITFNNRWQGMVTWNGSSFPITRFNQGRPSKPDMLLGGWNFITGLLASQIMPIGDLLDFYQVGDANGRTVIRGYRATSPKIAASGYYYPDQDLFAVIVDSPDAQIPGSSNAYTYYEFSFEGLNQVRGSVWTVGVGTQPSGSGTPMVGNRTVEVDTNPPTSTTDLPPFKLGSVATPTKAAPVSEDAAARQARDQRFTSVLKLLPTH